MLDVGSIVVVLFKNEQDVVASHGRVRLFSKRTIQICLAVTVGAVAAAAYLLFSQYGRAADELEARKRLYIQFAASPDAVAFPVPVDGAIGLIYFNRASSVPYLIVDKSASFSFASFSKDSQRLLVVRQRKGSRLRELLSCTVADWRCAALWRTEASIVSPIEIKDETILFSSSPLIQRSDGQLRYAYNDFFLLEGRSAPIKLSDFRLYQLGSLNFVGGKLFFSASGPLSEPPIIPAYNPLGRAESDIFALDFDLTERHIPHPGQTLRPLSATKIEGYSINQSISTDASRLAFLNQRIVGGRSRYNVAISTMRGSLLKYVEAQGIGFSQPAYIGTMVLMNELFEDRYEIHEIDVNRSFSKILYSMPFTKEFMYGLKRVELIIEE